MSEWISVKDELPKKEGTYLCACGAYYYILRFAFDLHKIDRYDFRGEHRSGFYDYDREYGYYECREVTHWMDIPKPTVKIEF